MKSRDNISLDELDFSPWSSHCQHWWYQFLWYVIKFRIIIIGTSIFLYNRCSNRLSKLLGIVLDTNITTGCIFSLLIMVLLKVLICFVTSVWFLQFAKFILLLIIIPVFSIFMPEKVYNKDTNFCYHPRCHLCGNVYYEEHVLEKQATDAAHMFIKCLLPWTWKL